MLLQCSVGENTAGIIIQPLCATQLLKESIRGSLWSLKIKQDNTKPFLYNRVCYSTKVHGETASLFIEISPLSHF